VTHCAVMSILGVHLKHVKHASMSYYKQYSHEAELLKGNSFGYDDTFDALEVLLDQGNTAISRVVSPSLYGL